MKTPKSISFTIIIFFLFIIDQLGHYVKATKERESDESYLQDEEMREKSIITEEMIQLVLGLKRGGDRTSNRYQNNGNTAKRRRRMKKSKSTLKTKNSPEKRTQSTHSYQTPVSILIPGYGKAEGRRKGGIDIWRGIPYAAPPVGALRFAPPEAAASWAPARLDASQFGPDCFQLLDPVLNPTAKQMSEDCLYLNVFTPAAHAARSRQGKFLSGAKLLPVMLWLHGGGFQQGGANRKEFDGRRLAERDIIVVTINYRLGALGFLVSSSDGLYGNFGLMDQRAAIDWVKGNIRAFGGDPDNITLFGESAGAVMIGLHLLMDGVGTLFHKAIMQSNPLGYRFRTVVIADFIGEALKRAVDCGDLECLRSERVEEIMLAQSSLMGVPRSVGDFFTWSPTLTKEVKLQFSIHKDDQMLSRSSEHRLPRIEVDQSKNSFVSEWRVGGDEITSASARWSAVNVSQPLKLLDRIPDGIPVMIGSNKHEGEMFVHTAFPAPMPKAVYWMFVGALFRDSAGRVLQHYRGLVEEVESKAVELAKKQLEEKENKYQYIENQEQLHSEYEMLLEMNNTKTKRRDKNVISSDTIKSLLNTWGSGGYRGGNIDRNRNFTYSKALSLVNEQISNFSFESMKVSWAERLKRLKEGMEEKRNARIKAKSLKEAAKVVVDYRPVMSSIINDYLFRCPSWSFAHLLSESRHVRGKDQNNIYVYHFSLPTHIPGYEECWGKSCHTSELPYIFQSMDLIRSNYSTLSPYAQEEAPAEPEYPYTRMMAAYRGALEAAEQLDELDPEPNVDPNMSTSVGGDRNYTKVYQRLLDHFFFGDYKADDEMASDMAERWTSFARGANPNYDASAVEWLPWGHKLNNSTFLNADVSAQDLQDTENIWDEGDHSAWDSDDEFEYWSEFEETDDHDNDSDIESLDIDEIHGSFSSDRNLRARYVRARALEAMQMEVAEEDVFKTQLRRIEQTNQREKGDGRRSFFGKKKKKELKLMSKSEAIEAVRMAQELGLLGIGLEYGLEPIFPEIFELRWPPEGRLVERDCTCQFWDRIQCKICISLALDYVALSSN